MDDDLSELLDELVNDNVDIEETRIKPVEETKVGGNNLEEVFFKKMGSFFDSGQIVINELQDRLQQGDTSEGTMMGYTQTLTTLKGLLDTAQKPLLEKSKQQHQIIMEGVKHEYKAKEIELKNAGKTPDKIEQNNLFIGGGFQSIKELLRDKGIDVKEAIEGVVDV